MGSIGMPAPTPSRAASTDFLEGMQRNAAEVSNLLKMLSHEVRLLVLCHLRGGELAVGEINARVPLSQSALSQHLAALRSEGLVATRRQGQSIYYRLADDRAGRLLAALHDLYCAVDERGRRP